MYLEIKSEVDMLENSEESKVSEIHQEVYTILLSLGQFYRANPQDTSRYSLSQITLEILSLVTINLVIPILTGLSTNWIYDKTKDYLAQNSNYIGKLSKKELEREIYKLITDSKPIKIIPERQLEALSAIEELLLYHGCPQRKVRMISEEIVSRISHIIKESES
jgi:hypothetical protein